jgi:archaeal type IV pilus assembly protein PilA
MKLLKSRKALSPVVASIILIAVTVAVSIAVAAWMGALTVGFMNSESITITSTTFTPNHSGLNSTNSIVLTMKNTGTKQVTIGQVRINNALISSANLGPSSSLTINAGVSNVTLTISNAGWISGNTYKIDLFDTSGTVVGSTQPNAGS